MNFTIEMPYPKIFQRLLEVTIFASNKPSIELFTCHGFERWGRDLVMMGRRVD